jgi:hypothetical protein
MSSIVIVTLIYRRQKCIYQEDILVFCYNLLECYTLEVVLTMTLFYESITNYSNTTEHKEKPSGEYPDNLISRSLFV